MATVFIFATIAYSIDTIVTVDWTVNSVNAMPKAVIRMFLSGVYVYSSINPLARA